MSEEHHCANPKCYSFAKYLCRRCSSASYCGKQCQVSDFAAHRLTCFELPLLAALTVSGSPEITTMQEIALEGSSLKTQTSVSSMLNEANIQTAPLQKPLKPELNVPTATLPKPLKPELNVPTSRPPAQVIATAPQIKQHKPELDLQSIRRTHQITAALPPPKPKEAPKVFFDDLKIIPLPSHRQFNAKIFAGVPETKLFVICEVSDLVQELSLLIDSTVLEVTAKDDKPYKPQLNEVVLAKYEEVFYRAVCTDSNNDGYTVHFFDYGNHSLVQAKDIRAFSQKVPIERAVHSCLFENFPDELTNELVEVLNQDTVSLEEAHHDGKQFCARMSCF